MDYKNKVKKYICISIIIFVSLITYHLNEKYQCSKMLIAITNDDIKQLQNVLKWGDPNSITGIPILENICEMPYKKTPLQLACYNGNIDMVKLLIKNGADVNYTPRNAIYSPLICAAIGQNSNNIDIVKYLIENGADVNYECNVKRPVISWIVNSKVFPLNGVDILKELVKAGANPKKMDYLNDVCYWKHEDAIYFFIEECNYDIRGGRVISQYCRGVNNYSYEIFEYFLQRGADIYIKDEHGKSALDYLNEQSPEWAGVVVKMVR